MLEAALMLEARCEVSNSFDDIVHQRETCVLRTAFRILGNWADAEDVAQEVFLRLHRHGLLFETDAAFGSWMYRVTVNLCLDKARRRTARPSVEMPDLPSKDLSAETSVIRDQQKQQLMEALETLPPRERAAIVLREIEGLSTGEVAVIMGSAEATVRSQVAKAMSRLREILSKGAR
ncbi:MAG TPA: RNA polymerase sigma factor [Bryobacteraceae bacterium]|nr:RNA polymerase sigma factor [Bryobacteraceae bacterium]